MTEQKLSNCTYGLSGIITRVEGNSPSTTRLLEMGVVPGEWIRVLQVGSPTLLQVGGSRICVRVNELESVSVIPADEDESLNRIDSFLQEEIPETSPVRSRI